MGVTVQIGDNVVELSYVTQGWLEDQIIRRKKDRVPICVIVRVQQGGADLILATQACGNTGGGGGRPPNRKEQEIFRLWNEGNLNSGDFSAGSFYSFLQHLKRLF
jgi:hypothetical protein